MNNHWHKDAITYHIYTFCLILFTEFKWNGCSLFPEHAPVLMCILKSLSIKSVFLILNSSSNHPAPSIPTRSLLHLSRRVLTKSNSSNEHEASLQWKKLLSGSIEQTDWRISSERVTLALIVNWLTSNQDCFVLLWIVTYWFSAKNQPHHSLKVLLCLCLCDCYLTGRKHCVKAFSTSVYENMSCWSHLIMMTEKKKLQEFSTSERESWRSVRWDVRVLISACDSEHKCIFSSAIRSCYFTERTQSWGKSVCRSALSRVPCCVWIQPM